MVELVDENAGSDGDIFTHSFKLFGLGPVIGKRTWGGVIGISPRHALVDGTIVTQPEFAFWFKDVGFGVENYGTEPTVEVEITPEEWGMGKDTQLEKGIDVAMKLMKKYEGRVKYKE
jgi:Periplasmic protease